MKKIFAVVVAIAMVMALSVPAFAADSYMAYIGFADSSWAHSAFHPDTDGVEITGDGQYSIETTQFAGAADILVFVIDFEGMYADNPNITATVDSIEIDGAPIEFDASKVVSGDRENNGNYRLEIYNEYGDTKADAPINNQTSISSSIKVTFTVSGMSAAAEAPAAEEAPAETAPAETAEDVSETEQSSRPPSVGFGIFGIKGSRKVDIFYDLTNIFFIILGIIAVPAAFIIRRRICLMMFRKKCISGNKSAAIASYKKFCSIIKQMKLPLSDGSDGEEYAKRLAERSPLLSDGTAEIIMQTALKASFGEKYLTADDSKNSVITVKSFAKRYYETLSKFGKFKAKYIYCIV